MLFGSSFLLGSRTQSSVVSGAGLEEDINNMVDASRAEEGTPSEVAERLEEAKASSIVFRAREDALRGELEDSRERAGAVPKTATLFRRDNVTKNTALDIASRDRALNRAVNVAWPETRKKIYLEAAEIAAQEAEKGIGPDGAFYAPSGMPLGTPMLAETMISDETLDKSATKNIAIVLGATVLLAWFVVKG